MDRVRFGAYWGDPLLSERALARAVAALGPVRRIVLFGDEPTLDRLLAELGAADLFGEPRAIVVRRADPLTKERRLARALADGVPPDVALFLLGDALRGPVVEAAEEALGLPSPTGRALRALAADLLAEADVHASPAVVDLLVEAAGGSTLRLSHEVGKLALWKDERLPPKRLPELLFFSGGAPYPYLDAVGMRNPGGALAELRTLLRGGGASAPALFFSLVAHVRALLAAEAARAGGRTPSGPAWLVRRRLTQSRTWGEARLVSGLASLQQLDVWIKTGRLSPEAALYYFTLGLGRGGPG